MSPKITKAMADSAIKDGAKVKTKRSVSKPKSAPIPTPPQTPNLEALTGAIGELVSSLKDQLKVSQQQLQEAQRYNEELKVMVAGMNADKPVRIKPVRDMERGSPTYLLTQYIDMVPVSYKRKLDS